MTNQNKFPVKLQLRMDNYLALPTSKVTIDQKQIEQIVTAVLPTNTDQLTTEQLVQENRELKALIQGMIMGQSLGSSELRQLQFEMRELKRDMEETKQVLQRSEQREEQMLTKQHQSEQREEEMLSGQKRSERTDKQLLRRVRFIQAVVMFIKRQVTKIQPVIKSIQKHTKPVLYASLGATLLGDLGIDLFKEVVKKMIGEERFEAWGEAIKPVLKPMLEPVIDPFLDTASLVSPMFSPTIKTATALLLVAVLILNHTGTVWQPFRRGLEKFRSLFASK